MSSSLLLQQCPACLVRLTWIVFVMVGRWLYSWEGMINMLSRGSSTRKIWSVLTFSLLAGKSVSDYCLKTNTNVQMFFTLYNILLLLQLLRL